MHAPDWSKGVALGTSDCRVKTLNAGVQKAPYTGPMVAATKAPDYALEVFTRGVLHSPDWSNVNREGGQRGSKDKKRALH